MRYISIDEVDDMIELTIVSGNGRRALDQGLVRTFQQPKILLGRASDCDWTLVDEQKTISGTHAIIQQKSGEYQLIDVSRNGTYLLNGDVLSYEQPYALSQQDRFQIGPYVFEVSQLSHENLDQHFVQAGFTELETDTGADDCLLVNKEESLQTAASVNEHSAAQDFTDFLQTPVFNTPLVEDPVGEPEKEIASRMTHKDSTLKTTTKLAAKKPVLPIATHTSEHRQSVIPLKPELKSRTDDFFSLFCAYFQIDEHLFDERARRAFPQRICEIMAGSLEAIIGLLASEAQFRQKMQLPITTINAQGNNPLRFSANVKQALEMLLRQQGDSFLPPAEALAETKQTLKRHQEAFMSGMPKALEDFLQDFSPENLAGQLAQKEGKRFARPHFFNAVSAWQYYQKWYQQGCESAQDNFSIRYQRHFLTHYTAQISTQTQA